MFDITVVSHTILTRSPGEVLVGDIDGDGVLAAMDIDALTATMIAHSHETQFDLNADCSVDSVDHMHWVKDLKSTWFGDANLDGEFNSGDLVAVFGAGKYEQDVAASWAEGDWDPDGRFNSGDLVAAFTDGGYEQGPRVATNAVPEPTSLVMIVAGVIGMAIRWHRQSQPAG